MARRSRPHQERALACIQLIEPTVILQPEFSIPQATRQIDGVMFIGTAALEWGVLAREVSDRVVIIEHWSRPPSTGHLATAHFKRAALVESWALALIQHGERAPLLLILSNGHPRNALNAISHLEASSTRGIFASRPCGLGQTVLLDIKGLERIDGTSVLKLLRAPETDQEIVDNIEHVRRDAMLSEASRRRLLEVMMSQSPFTDIEQKITYQSIFDKATNEGIQKGFERGIEKGIEKGIAKGRRESLLKVAHQLFAPQICAELAAVEDLDQLEAAVLKRLSDRAQ